MRCALKWIAFFVVFSALTLSASFGRVQAASFIWTKQDVEKTQKFVEDKKPIVTTENTVFIKPPFYSGTLPLKYLAKNIAMFGGSFGSTGNIPLFQEFPEWKTFFLYVDTKSFLFSIPDGAVTIDSKTHHIVAEAKTLGIIKGSGVEIEEYHYDEGGNLIFECTSKIDFGGNFKTQEKVKKGKKIKDYYFLFPVTGH
jgi:hypothetical protein